jgi:hypothetical protein
MSTEIPGDPEGGFKAVSRIPKPPKLIGIQETQEFQGWDSGEISDTAMIFEFQHAWKDFHDKHSCPVKPNIEVLQSAKKICFELGLPFRWYLKLAIQILGRFPKPWEINYKWLQEEIALEWLELKHTKVAVETDHSPEAEVILNREESKNGIR